jgi:glycosyltransferase involved in cell wall biosynthesis
MKVLFISSWYPSATNALKGIFVKKHAAAISAAGVQIQVLALTINYSAKLYEKKILRFKDEYGVDTYLIEINSRFYKGLYLNLFWQYRLIKKAYRAISSEFKLQVIHSNVLFPAGILGYWLGRRENLPYIITEHWSKVPRFMQKSLWANEGRKAYKEAKAVTVVSTFLKSRIESYIEVRSKVVVIPNVINTALFQYAERKKAIGEISFACVAHWQAPKRPDLIFSALNEYSQMVGDRIILKVVGEGALMEVLKRKKWNFEIIYYGNLASGDLADVLKKTDYFLHASEIETFSIVIAEALATGIPVLSSGVGAIPELIDESNGLVCGNSAKEWLQGLQKLTEKKYDRKQISGKAQKFDPLHIGKKFRDLYQAYCSL